MIDNENTCNNMFCPARVNQSKRDYKIEAFQNSRDLDFKPPLDEEIRDIVLVLIKNGVETFESCEGGRGHSFAEPTVRFFGESAEGLRALSIAISHGLPVSHLRRAWDIVDNCIDGPYWEMTFIPPKDSQIWTDRNTSERYTTLKTEKTND